MIQQFHSWIFIQSTQLTKVHIVKAMIFPGVMCRCENCTIKKSEHQRIDAFELLWSWRRLLRVPWTTKRSNQSILKEINPKYSLEGLLLKLKVLPGKNEGRKRRERQRIRWLGSITDLMDINLSELWEIVEDGGAFCATGHEIAQSDMT